MIIMKSNTLDNPQPEDRGEGFVARLDAVAKSIMLDMAPLSPGELAFILDANVGTGEAARDYLAAIINHWQDENADEPSTPKPET